MKKKNPGKQGGSCCQTGSLLINKRERERERKERIITDIETISKMHFADFFGLQNLHDLIW